MGTQSNYEIVYVGFEVNVQYLQNILEKAGILSRIRNEFQAGLRSGFASELPGQSQLLVAEEDYSKAKRIADDTFPQDEEE